MINLISTDKAVDVSQGFIQYRQKVYIENGLKPSMDNIDTSRQALDADQHDQWIAKL